MKLYKARHILKDIRDDNADEYDNDTKWPESSLKILNS